jgi:hypothetical protein
LTLWFRHGHDAHFFLGGGFWFRHGHDAHFFLGSGF